MYIHVYACIYMYIHVYTCVYMRKLNCSLTKLCLIGFLLNFYRQGSVDHPARCPRDQQPAGSPTGLNTQVVQRFEVLIKQ